MLGGFDRKGRPFGMTTTKQTKNAGRLAKADFLESKKEILGKLSQLLTWCMHQTDLSLNKGITVYEMADSNSNVYPRIGDSPGFSRKYQITSLRVIPAVTSDYYIFVTNSDVLCAKIWRRRKGEDNFDEI